MTKDEILDQYDSAFAGMLLDSWSQQRTGEAQIIFLRRIAPRSREMLSRLFDEAVRCGREDQAKFLGNDGPTKELFGTEPKKKGRVKDDDRPREHE